DAGPLPPYWLLLRTHAGPRTDRGGRAGGLFDRCGYQIPAGVSEPAKPQIAVELAIVFTQVGPVPPELEPVGSDVALVGADVGAKPVSGQSRARTQSDPGKYRSSSKSNDRCAVHGVSPGSRLPFGAAPIIIRSPEPGLA